MSEYLGPYKLGPFDTESWGIYAGDARVLSEAIPDESVDLILTDPPFGIDFNYSHDFDDSPEAYPDLVHWIVKESNRVIKPGGLCFVFVAQPKLRHIWSLFPDDSRIFAACKNFVQFRPTDVQFAFDPVIFWKKSGNSLTKFYAGKRDWHIGNHANTNERSSIRSFFHGARPLNTIMYIVSNFCPPGTIVLDWFMGSGTTAVAARILRRRWWGSEIDPGIADLARRRVAQTQPPLEMPMPEQLALDLNHTERT